MGRVCRICKEEFNTKGTTRIYCYTCSPTSTRKDITTRKHHKTILRNKMKEKAINILGGKCSICSYTKCINALEFHHQNPEEKEFKLASGNTMSWEQYKKEIGKCILVCSNCHKEIHAKRGYNKGV